MYFKLLGLFVFVLFLSRKAQQGMRHHFRHAKSLLEYRTLSLGLGPLVSIVLANAQATLDGFMPLLFGTQDGCRRCRSCSVRLCLRLNCGEPILGTLWTAYSQRPSTRRLSEKRHLATRFFRRSMRSFPCKGDLKICYTISSVHGGLKVRSALIFALRNAVEHNPAVVYKAVFLGETIDLVQRRPGWSCRALDFDVDDVSLTAIASLLLEKPNAVLIWAEVHHARLAIQIGQLVRTISPDTRILVFGRGPTFIPQLYGAAPFHVAHAYGDREATIDSFLTHVEDASSPVVGGLVAGPDGVIARTPGRWLPPDTWPWPALDQLPLDRYGAFTERVHGEGYSKRLSVTVAKGCTLGCAYCGATEEEGKTDRRRDVGALFDWFERSGVATRDSLVHLYAPDLFADASWVRTFCAEHHRRNAGIRWRGVTTTRTLQNEEVVEIAAQSGCRELAIGIEHVSEQRMTSVKSTLAELDRAATLAARYGIVLKGLVMIGYPGQSEQDIEFLERLANGWGIVLRYTGYTPLHHLRRRSREELLDMNLEKFDRRTYYDESATTISPSFFFERLTKNGGYFRPSKSFADPSAIAA
jgi:radical SAM superfamily enzyme YgiQ (UPF0313 family)